MDNKLFSFNSYITRLVQLATDSPIQMQPLLWSQGKLHRMISIHFGAIKLPLKMGQLFLLIFSPFSALSSLK